MGRKLVDILFFLLCVNVVLDPGNSIFYTKEMLFIGCFFVGIVYCIVNKITIIDKNVIGLCLLWGAFIPAYGFVVGILRNQYFDWDMGAMYVKSFLFIWILLIHKTAIPFGRYLSIASLFIILPCFYLYFTISSFSPDEMYYFMEKDAAFISRRMFAGGMVNPVIYYKTSALSVFGISWLCSSLLLSKSAKEKIIKAIILLMLLFLLFFSYSRAIFVSVGVILLYYFYQWVKDYKLFRWLFWPGIVLGVFVVLPILVSKVLFVPGEEGNAIKVNHLISYMELFNGDVLTLLLGQGLGAGFYTSGFESITYMAELSYVELFRFFGLFLTGFIILILVYPLLFYFRNKKNIVPDVRYIYIAYALYLFCIGTNPLLLSSTGMIVLVIVYSTVFTKRYLYEKP
jgi:hypothetical protein